MKTKSGIAAGENETTFPLRILHLEDDPRDSALVQSTLEAGGIACEMTLAQGHDEFVAALHGGNHDLIILDFSVPGFGGSAALALALAEAPALPVIVVSGTLGEELAIELLKSGATDYVLKDRLSRIVPAVQRAMRDVEARTERRRLEAEIIEAQKLEVVGRLAGGVAHDFNNILAVIMGYADMLTKRLDTGSPLKKYSEEILHASGRAAGLTRQLLVFSRKQTIQPVVLDLNDVVKDLDTMLGRLIDENIAMTIVPGVDVGRIKADPGYVGQVLMNLVVNARDAMPNGGTLTIATRSVTLDKDYARSHAGVIPGRFVVLSVTDTGTGMTEDVKVHLFEPFFTTKPTGKGTGLGLATCRTIAQQSGGHIDVESEIGKGSTLNICFPQVEQPFTASVHPVAAGPSPHGIETLLVVEDEISVRQLTCGVLEALGYHVLQAANGQDALRVARENRGAPISLVITDVIMPLMGGKVMAEWLRTVYPGLKILFTSGYTDDVITHDGVLEAGADFLPKPYAPATLAHKVREILDGASAHPIDPEKGVAPHESIVLTP